MLHYVLGSNEYLDSTMSRQWWKTYFDATIAGMLLSHASTSSIGLASERVWDFPGTPDDSREFPAAFLIDHLRIQGHN